MLGFPPGKYHLRLVAPAEISLNVTACPEHKVREVTFKAAPGFVVLPLNINEKSWVLLVKAPLWVTTKT